MGVYMDGSQFASGEEIIYGYYRLSWLAYLKTVLGALVMLLVLLFMSGIWLGATAENEGLHRIFVVLTSLLVVVFLGVTVYRILYLKSVELYTNDTGVWMYRGILPWSRGTIGVKWRDLEDAIYYTGFVSWVFKSYTVRVGHRFTKTSELVIRDVAKGQEAVEHINQMLREKISSVSL